MDNVTQKGARLRAEPDLDGLLRLLDPHEGSAKQAVRLVVCMLLCQLAVAVHIGSRVPLVLQLNAGGSCQGLQEVR